MTLSASQVLHQHVLLTERLRRPDKTMVMFMTDNMRVMAGERGSHRVSMFFPVITTARDQITFESGAELARLLGHGLAESVTFQVTANMCRDMMAVFGARQQIHRIDAQEMPCPRGFAWLDTPWRVNDEMAARALSWEYTEVWSTSDDDTPSSLWPCARIALWLYEPDLPLPDQGYDTVGPLVLTHTVLMPLSRDFGWTGEDDPEGSPNRFLSLIHLLWMFLGMEITSSEPAPVKAGYLRRARRAIHNPVVKVVTLRKLRHATDAPGTSRRIDWTCRWPVQGHYRHRERPADGHHALPGGLDKHCTICGQETSWVRPYFKGPDGMPLKVTEKTVYRLAR